MRINIYKSFGKIDTVYPAIFPMIKFSPFLAITFISQKMRYLEIRYCLS